MPPIFRIIPRILPLCLKRLGEKVHGNVGLSRSLLARRASAALQGRLAEIYKALAASTAKSPHGFTLRLGRPEYPPTNIEGTRAWLLYEWDSFGGKSPRPLLDQVTWSSTGGPVMLLLPTTHPSKPLDGGGLGWGKGTSHGNFLLAA
jgi:hypothetical protein